MMPQSDAGDSDSPPCARPGTLGDALHWAAAQLAGADGPSSCRLLLQDATGLGPATLLAFPERPLDAHAWQRFEANVSRHAAGIPLAYVRGRQGFWTLDLEVTPDTLIPRAETERLVELALPCLPQARSRILDLGTGSGAIALALASERPECEVVAVDASAAALEVARRNARRCGVEVRFLHSDWFAALGNETWDLIVSNPPYIAEDDPHLGRGDLPAEPRSALSSGRDGLDALRVIVAGAPARLRAGAWLLVEHGWNQGAAVRALFADAGLVAVRTEQDLEQRDRVTLGQRATGD